MIDTERGGTFVTYVNVDPYMWERPELHDSMWKYLKEQLIYKFYTEIFMSFMDGGWHTFNLIFVQENLDDNGPYIRFGVVGKIFAVQERTRVMETVSFSGDRYSLPTLKKEWKILCAGCGNVFTPDKRGGCSACGSPADWIKNWTLEVK